MTTERTLPTRLGDWARAHPRLLGTSVIVGALALAGISVIIASTLFSGVPVAGEVDPTPSPSGSAAPSASAEPSAAPTASAEPTPVPGAEWPPVADASTQYLLPPMWAVSVVDDLRVRSGPGTVHPVIAELDAGDLAKVLDINNAEWVYVAVDGAIGYVNVGPEGDRYLVGTKTPWATSFRSVTGIASDGVSYLAYGHQLEAEYPPYELLGYPSLVLRSEDGITWTPLEDGPQSSVLAAEASEDGWVAIVQVPLGGTLTSYSPDGVTWEGLVGGSVGLTDVVHGPAGWVVIGQGESWTSTDGRSWDGPHAMVPAETQPPSEIESSDAGYVAFDRMTGGLFTSADGVDWADASQAGMRVSDGELVGDQLHVVLADANGATTVRRGTLGATGVAWAGSPQSVGSGLHVDRITRGPDALLAIGWEEEGLTAVTWSSTDGTSWQRLSVGEDGLDGVGFAEPEWGSAGWVTSTLKRSTDGATWLPADISLAYDGPVPPCPPAEEVSTIVLAYLGQHAEGCLGETSVTIRGVVAELGFGGCCPPNPEPGWLATPWPPAIIASGDPGEGFGTFQLVLYPAPGIDRSLFDQPRTWVEVVGHYRDPASSTCLQRPRPDFPSPLGLHDGWQAECRQHFVVESVVEVDGP